MSSLKMKFYKKFCRLALHNAVIYQIKLNIRLHSLYNLYSVSVQGLNTLRRENTPFPGFPRPAHAFPPSPSALRALKTGFFTALRFQSQTYTALCHARHLQFMLRQALKRHCRARSAPASQSSAAWAQLQPV